jgi:ADP-ribose pyrophosphatase YjhB (NUDIX family)
LEETGLEVEVGPLLDVFDSIFPDDQGGTLYHYVLVDYLCRPLSGTPCASSDAAELRWASPAELADLGVKPATIGVIQKALALQA